jgi:hypothetical protein
MVGRLPLSARRHFATRKISGNDPEKPCLNDDSDRFRAYIGQGGTMDLADKP